MLSWEKTFWWSNLLLQSIIFKSRVMHNLCLKNNTLCKTQRFFGQNYFPLNRPYFRSRIFNISKSIDYLIRLPHTNIPPTTCVWSEWGWRMSVSTHCSLCFSQWSAWSCPRSLSRSLLLIWRKMETKAVILRFLCVYFSSAQYSLCNGIFVAQQHLFRCLWCSVINVISSVSLRDSENDFHFLFFY